MLIVDNHCNDIHCDEFPVPQIDRESKQVKNSNQYGETRYFKHQKYQNLWMNNKVRGD